MALSAQSQRSLKLLTAVATVGVGIQGVFLSDYNIEGMEGREHVFTQVRKDLRQWIDVNMYGYDGYSGRSGTGSKRIDGSTGTGSSSSDIEDSIVDQKLEVRGSDQK